MRPRLARCSMPDRLAESWYDLVSSPRVIAEQSGVRSAIPEGLSFIQGSQPEYVWFRQSDRDLKNWLLAHGYRMDVDTPESFIAVRADLPPLHTSPSGGFGCFPAP